MLKVLIADDHAIVRKGLREILREGDAESEVGEASDGEEALVKIRAGDWDVAIVDITMPVKTGLEVLRDARHEKPQLPVIVLSMHTGRQYVVGAIKEGASGYLSKETAPEELLEAIRAVLSGRKYVSRDLRPLVEGEAGI